jgi:hypothetical protein
MYVWIWWHRFWPSDDIIQTQSLLIDITLMANFVKLIVLVSSLFVIFPASSLAQQTSSGPEATVLPKQPIILIADFSEEFVAEPTAPEVITSQPLNIGKTDTGSKSKHHIVRFTDSIKAKNTVKSSAFFSGDSSIDLARRKD